MKKSFAFGEILNKVSDINVFPQVLRGIFPDLFLHNTDNNTCLRMARKLEFCDQMFIFTHRSKLSHDMDC